MANIWQKWATFYSIVGHTGHTFLSVAEGRPRNYLSCCWIFCLIYALSTSPTMLPPIYLSSSIFICQSINRPLPFPKNQYIIAADPGPGIGLVFKLKGLKG